jgi:hypothetical protein
MAVDDQGHVVTEQLGPGCSRATNIAAGKLDEEDLFCNTPGFDLGPERLNDSVRITPCCPMISRTDPIGCMDWVREFVRGAVKKPVKSGFFENRDAQTLRDFAQAQVQMQMLFEDGDQNIDADGYPALGLHGVLRSAVASPQWRS